MGRTNRIDRAARILILGAGPGSGTDLEKELTKGTWMVGSGVAAILDWYAKSAIEQEAREAAKLAAEILRLTKEKSANDPN